MKKFLLLLLLIASVCRASTNLNSISIPGVVVSSGLPPGATNTAALASNGVRVVTFNFFPSALDQSTNVSIAATNSNAEFVFTPGDYYFKTIANNTGKFVNDGYITIADVTNQHWNILPGARVHAPNLTNSPNWQSFVGLFAVGGITRNINFDGGGELIGPGGINTATNELITFNICGPDVANVRISNLRVRDFPGFFTLDAPFEDNVPVASNRFIEVDHNIVANTGCMNCPNGSDGGFWAGAGDDIYVHDNTFTNMPWRGFEFNNQLVAAHRERFINNVSIDTSNNPLVFIGIAGCDGVPLDDFTIQGFHAFVTGTNFYQGTMYIGQTAAMPIYNAKISDITYEGTGSNKATSGPAGIEILATSFPEPTTMGPLYLKNMRSQGFQVVGAPASGATLTLEGVTCISNQTVGLEASFTTNLVLKSPILMNNNTGAGGYYDLLVDTTSKPVIVWPGTIGTQSGSTVLLNNVLTNQTLNLFTNASGAWALTNRITNIPQTANSLVIEWTGAYDNNNSASVLFLRFNNDSGSHYGFEVDGVYAAGGVAGFATSSSASNQGAFGRIFVSGLGPTMPAGYTLQIPNYTNNFGKAYTSSGAYISSFASMIPTFGSGIWTNATPITSIDIYPLSGGMSNWSFRVYGRN